MQVGQRLSEARRRKNLTLADVARTTRIPLHYLQAIDRDDADRLPRGLFARAFVRTYANEVGLNPSDLMDSVDETVSPESEEQMPALPAPADTPVSMRSLLLIIPVAAVCGFCYVGFAPATTSDAPQAAAEVSVPTAAPVEPVAAAVPEAASDVELQIHSRGGCIVAVTADGRVIPSDTLPPGQPVVLKARGEVILRVGDSGTCPPAVKPNSTPRSPRRVQIDTVPESPAAMTQTVDQQSNTAAPLVEPVPAASDAVLPQPDQPAPPAIIEQF